MWLHFCDIKDVNNQFMIVCVSDECGIVAQISQPLADSDISAYYISTFSFDHALVSLTDVTSLVTVGHRYCCQGSPNFSTSESRYLRTLGLVLKVGHVDKYQEYITFIRIL